MSSEILFVFFAAAAALTVLTILGVILAARHDKQLALAGPLEEERAVVARVAEKRAALLDLDQDLEKRRQALANLAEVQAEADALSRQRDELMAEWNQLSARREEVAASRRETEEARTEALAVSGELGTAKRELEEVRERLARAEDLVHRIAALQAEEAALRGKVETQRDAARELEGAKRRAALIEEEARRLEREAIAQEETLTRRAAELKETESRLAVAREAAVRSGEDSLRVGAELAAARQRSAELAQERLSAEARKAALDREIEKAQGIAAGGPGAAPQEDPLRELKDPPQAIQRLTAWPSMGDVRELEALGRVKARFEALGLEYPDRTLRAFHTAMKVNDATQMTVLAGVSGTGKSQLPRQYAAGMGIGFLQIPVQPRWDSPQDLMGFYNYIEGRFRPTDMARALYALDERNNPQGAVRDRLLMLLLDEMNLARVEYYFSDFLSRLESRPPPGQEHQANLRKDAEIELEIPKSPQRIFPGYNLFFAGTMNEDESTQSLSDKVVDRANVLRFGAPSRIFGGAPAPERADPQAEQALSRQVWDSWRTRGALRGLEQDRALERVQEMLELMQDFGKPFGHRLGRAILAYAAAYPEISGLGDRVSLALADQIDMRLLPKLRGVDVEEKSAAFDRLRRLAAELGDEPLAEALGDSVAAAETTGQFVWKGVQR